VIYKLLLNDAPVKLARSMGSMLARILAVLVLLLLGCQPQPKPGPTPVQEPPQVQVLPCRGVEVDGHGSAQTDLITPLARSY